MQKPLAEIALSDLQAFASSLTGQLSSQQRTLNACKSLFTFAEKIGYLRANVAAMLLVPKARDTLAERILTVREVKKMCRAAGSARDAAVIALLYFGGIRRAELQGLRWQDCVAADDGGAFITVFGKGQKTRTVRVPRDVWSLISALRKEDVDLGSPVFVGRSGVLDGSTIWRIVRATAIKAGLKQPVSPHFMRHSHASHALDAGAPISLVRDTLGHASIGTTDRYLHVRPKESSGKYLR